MDEDFILTTMMLNIQTEETFTPLDRAIVAYLAARSWYFECYANLMVPNKEVTAASRMMNEAYNRLVDLEQSK